jgi:hypothetical protein
MNALESPRMNEPREPELAELAIGDPPELWRELGFHVDDDGHLDIGGVRVRLGFPGEGIVSWSLRRVNAMGSVDGLPTPVPRILRPPPFATHPNGATGIDHVVILTPDFDRTAAALQRAGMPLKRTGEAPNGARQGFRRVGPAILEVVHAPELDGADARFWGIAVVVISLEDLAERLGDHLGQIRPAVQPGRRVATLRASAGLTPALAFMSPEPP